MPKTLIIRADAGVAIGTGHVMRCLALAQAWQDAGGRCTFAMAESDPALRGRLSREGCEIHQIQSEVGSQDDAAEVARLARSLRAEWVVVDGYRFGGAYQEWIKAANLELLFVDDNGHAGRYSADLVLNQNVHATSDLYQQRAPRTELLLGLRYAMLRREFAGWRDWKRAIPEIASKILVTMGGSDPQNVTETAIHALNNLPADMTVRVVIGGSNPHYESLRQVLSGYGGRFELLHRVHDLPGLMAWADLAVSAAGSTCWEMCFLALPAVIIPVAENQRAAAACLDRLGAATQVSLLTIEDLAEPISGLLLCSEKRRNMSSIARSLVDGDGATRVVDCLLKPVAHAVGQR
ncbi:MAG TPA: UDP-2,4-diacetamido-2,4,6-trideoxy-beta-L-altropyranose hydrolase [Terriglobales bacterium]|nr:UDP-2,4-diacetamido-2,4,6-trideoxy-beta-L-altropyranose hydrolase [Terriglobales bacterium]